MKELFARNTQEKNKEADKIYLIQCFRRAVKYYAAGNIDAAKRFYGLATINNKKTIPEAAYNLAIIYKKENNIKKAIHYFETAYQTDTMKQKSARQLYQLCEKEGFFKASDFWFERIDLSKLAATEKVLTQGTEAPQLPSKENKKRILPPVPIFRP